MSGIWIKRRNREKWRGSGENTPARRSIQLNYSYPSCSGPPPPPPRAHVPTNPVVGQGNKPRQLTINHRCLSRHWNDVKHCICVIVHLFQSLGCHLTNCEPPVRPSARLSIPSRAPFTPSRARGPVAMPRARRIFLSIANELSPVILISGGPSGIVTYWIIAIVGFDRHNTLSGVRSRTCAHDASFLLKERKASLKLWIRYRELSFFFLSRCG